MILVNNSGGRATYAPLKHADWHGWTPTDLVFPFFLFIVGVSIPFALASRRDDPARRRPALAKIIRRSLVLFAIGLFLAKFPFFRANWHEIQDPENWLKMAKTLRIPGVLQRIALCYLAASLVFLNTRLKGQVLTVVGLLVGYWAALAFIPVPGFGAGDLARGHDLGSYLDRLLLPGHIYKSDYDPEGLLSTLPAIATTLLGVLAGQWLRSGRDRFEVDSGLFVAGLASCVAGSAWGMVYPINKALWTGSFVLWTGGLALLGLATCYWLIDLHGHRRWAYPFRVFGGNAIAAYVLAAIGARLFNLPTIARTEGKMISVHQWLYDGYLLPTLSPYNASLAYAALIVLACFLIVAAIDKLGVHIRV
jgi:predicted acyltransferase